MPASLHLSSVHLRVPDLTRSVEFYTRRLGFVSVESVSSTVAHLGVSATSAPLLTLTQAASAAQPSRNAAGLFHAALLFPNRSALATWLQFAATQGVDFEGFSDHGVSEAIYLSDPDGKWT